MKQRAHAWVALRAFKLIEDSGKAPKLAELLSYYLSDVWDGSWLPDTLIRDMKYGHIFKMDSDPEILGDGDEIKNKKRFIAPYTELNSKLCGDRLCLNYIKHSEELKKPYRTHPDLSGHLPNRVIALSHTIGDMLKMGDFPIAFYVKKEKSKEYMKDLSEQNVKTLSFSPNFSARQVAISFFMMSHYICDVHMPLHCDLRDYTTSSGRRLPGDLHPSIEKKWESYFPEKEKIILHNYLKKSVDDVVSDLPGDSLIEVDSSNKYALSTKIRKTNGDEWKEMVYTARVSYAVSREWIAEPFNNVEVMINEISEDKFKDVTNRIFHDAVESVARMWYKSWGRFTG